MNAYSARRKHMTERSERMCEEAQYHNTCILHVHTVLSVKLKLFPIDNS